VNEKARAHKRHVTLMKMPEWVKGVRRRRSKIRDTEHGQKAKEKEAQYM
jgi:hypothetical protein